MIFLETLVCAGKLCECGGSVGGVMSAAKTRLRGHVGAHCGGLLDPNGVAMFTTTLLAVSLTLPSPVVMASSLISADAGGILPMLQSASGARAEVEVNFKGFGSRENEAGRLESRAFETVQDAGVGKARNEKDPLVVFTIEAMGPAGDEGYRVTLDATVEGKSLLDAPIEKVCEWCTEGEATGTISQVFTSVVPVLDRYAEELKAKEDAAAAAANNNNGTGDGTGDGTGNTGQTGTNNTGTGTDPGTSDTTPKGMGNLGKAGVGAAVVGAIAAGVGVGLAVTPMSQPDDMIGYELTNYKPPGYALIAAGGVALITGVALIVVDKRRRTQSSTTVAPVATPTSAGLVLSGRF